jgi:hypothetical protein
MVGEPHHEGTHQMGRGPYLRRRVWEWPQGRAGNGLIAARANTRTEPDGAGADWHRGCSAFDVVHILEKGREAIEDCVVELDAERAEKDPKVFTRVHMHFVVTGRALATAKVSRAIELSVEKYCSASAMLAKTAVITHDFEVVDTTANR